MSGVGKSALLTELARRGHRTVDTDYGDYFETVEPLLRESATLEVVTTVPVARVADIVLGHVV